MKVKMIELTEYNNGTTSPVYVNPGYINSFFPSEEHDHKADQGGTIWLTRIWLVGGMSYNVTETPEQILKMIT